MYGKKKQKKFEGEGNLNKLCHVIKSKEEDKEEEGEDVDKKYRYFSD